MAPKTKKKQVPRSIKSDKVGSKIQENASYLQLFYPLMALEYEHKLYQIPIRINFDVLEVLGQLIGATICTSDRRLH